MLIKDSRLLTIIKKTALYFFVLSFSLSNISFFNMVLSYVGYTGNITVLSSAVYAFFNLFILICFLHYVISDKAYKIFLLVGIVNLVYVLPFLINLDVRGITLYLMFPLPVSLMTGVLILNRDLRKDLIDVFCKLRYFYGILAIAYICFLAFYPGEGRGVLPDFTYGNVAWFFLPPIFIYTGVFYKQNFKQEFKLNKAAVIEKIIILLILNVTVFYTGLRSGIISLIFTNLLFLAGYLFFDAKHKKQYIQNFVLILLPFLAALLVSSLVKLEASRMNIISNNFLFEKNIHEVKKTDEDTSEPADSKTETSEVIISQTVIPRKEDPVAKRSESEISESEDSQTDLSETKTSEVKVSHSVVSENEASDKDAQETKVSETKSNDSVATDNTINLQEDVSKTDEISKRYITSPLHVRSEKNTEVSLGILPEGSIVEGFQEGAWFKIIYQGKEAYVASEFTSEEQLSDVKTLYATNSLPIRPEKNSKKSLGILPRWTEVEGFREGAWFRFIYEGKQAYIAFSALREEPPTEAELRASEIDHILAENSGYRIAEKLNVIDVEDNQVKTVNTVFMKHIAENDFQKKYTEKILREDVLKNREKYMIVRDRDRGRIARFRFKNDRYNLWNMAINEFKKSPIIGHGALSYQEKYDEFFPHNIFLEILADFGIVGFAIAMFLAIYLLIKSLKLIIKSKDSSMLILLLFGLSYIPAFLFYNSLYGDNALVYLITLLTTYVILNADEKKKKSDKKSVNAGKKTINLKNG
ncbi:MAG: O-antigen ligase family protein [Saccharofermentanales bacterium]